MSPVWPGAKSCERISERLLGFSSPLECVRFAPLWIDREIAMKWGANCLGRCPKKGCLGGCERMCLSGGGALKGSSKAARSAALQRINRKEVA